MIIKEYLPLNIFKLRKTIIVIKTKKIDIKYGHGPSVYFENETIKFGKS